MKYIIILSLFFINIYSQTRIVSGKIVDSENSEPLSKASIILLPSQSGVISNPNGEFQIQIASKDSVIKVSFVGFETKLISLADINFTNQFIIKLQKQIIPSQTVFVVASIGKEDVFTSTVSNIKQKSISENYVLQDVPDYLSTLPSTTFYSEGGNGVGYNYLSIRGFDQRRISVSINGIPQNEPEDHNVYWIDFPDILSSVELIQVQRGAGGSVFGYPAIGGSINIITSSFSHKPFVNLSTSYGTFNTKKITASYSSGLINNQYSFYAKFSQTSTSGYRENSWGKFNSYHFSAIRYDDKFTSQINFYGGLLEDGLVYTGLPKFVIKDKVGRRKNFSYWEANNNSYTYVLERKPEELENFSQPHYEILNEWRINDNLILNSALFMVIGKGFFDFDGSWADTSYLRLTSENGIIVSGNPSNVLIRAMVENNQFGWIPRLAYKHKNGELTLGAELRKHKSLHWGGINFGENLPSVSKDYRYYQYNGSKEIFNFFVNESYQFSNAFNFLAEVQFAFNRYRLFNEKYVNNDFSINNYFLNPRIALSCKLNESQKLYFDLAKVTREPRLKDYYDAGESSGGKTPQFEMKSDGTYDYNSPLVKPETMYSIDFGTAYNEKNFLINLNFFYMNFVNELVKSGQLDIFGAPVMGNAKKTIHMGAELSATLTLPLGLELTTNATYSRNSFRDAEQFIKYRDQIANAKKIGVINLSGNRISGFPDFLANFILTYRYRELLIQFSGRYVGKFYSDNFDTKLSEYLRVYPGFVSYSDNVNEAFFTANLYCSYEFNFFKALQNSKVFLQVNNIFNRFYSAMATGEEFFPAADRNFLTGIQIGL